MDNSNRKKADQLGMPHGTACNKLRKSIIFNFLKRLNENFCHQCGAEIEFVNELSIEHKVPYLDSDNPIELFFDLDNIAFSHLNCNINAARRKTGFIHPSTYAYAKGCRCDECKGVNALAKRKYRAKTSVVQ